MYIRITLVPGCPLTTQNGRSTISNEKSTIEQTCHQALCAERKIKRAKWETLVDLEDLKDGNGYLIDIGSTIDLFGVDTEQFLIGAGQPWQFANWDWNRKDKSVSPEKARIGAWENVCVAANTNVRKAIELLVVSDNLGFDETLSKTSRLNGLDLSVSFPGHEGILQPVEIPNKTRMQTADYLKGFSADFVSNYYEVPGLWHPADKDAHDFLEAIDPSTCLAKSFEHPLRAVFYLPPIDNAPGRRVLLARIVRAGSRDAVTGRGSRASSSACRRLSHAPLRRGGYCVHPTPTAGARGRAGDARSRVRSPVSCAVSPTLAQRTRGVGHGGRLGAGRGHLGPQLLGDEDRAARDRADGLQCAEVSARGRRGGADATRSRPNDAASSERLARRGAAWRPGPRPLSGMLRVGAGHDPGGQRRPGALDGAALGRALVGAATLREGEPDGLDGRRGDPGRHDAGHRAADLRR